MVMEAPTIAITLALFNLNGGELILVLALILILFGTRRLPDLGRGLGTGIAGRRYRARQRWGLAHRPLTGAFRPGCSCRAAGSLPQRPAPGNAAAPDRAGSWCARAGSRTERSDAGIG